MEEERAEQLEIPHVPPLPNNTLHVMKTSNVLAVAPRPFSEENYRAEFEAEEKEPISRARKVLRWRYVTGPDNIIRVCLIISIINYIYYIYIIQLYSLCLHKEGI